MIHLKWQHFHPKNLILQADWKISRVDSLIWTREFNLNLGFKVFNQTNHPWSLSREFSTSFMTFRLPLKSYQNNLEYRTNYKRNNNFKHRIGPLILRILMTNQLCFLTLADTNEGTAQMTILIFVPSCLTRKNWDWRLRRNWLGLEKINSSMWVK
jgi:hypothetical protein